jgi:hypothetical protein
MKQKSIKAGDLMLLQSPHIEVSGKLEPKWVGPFLVTKKNKTRLLLLGRHQRQGATALLKCRQPLLFLHLAQLCKLQGFIIYKRAFVVYPLHSTN